MNMSSCDTIYSGVEYLDDFQTTLLVCVHAVLIILNISVNMFVVVMMQRTRQLTSNSLRLIWYLSQSDICVGAVVQSGHIALLLSNTCTLERVVAFCGTFFGHTSGYLTFAISFDRYVRVKYLRTYTARFNASHYETSTLVFIIVVSLLHSTLYLLGSQGVMPVKTATTINLAIEVLLIVLGLGFYAASIFVLRGHRKNTDSSRIVESMSGILKVASRMLISICICYVTYIVIRIAHIIVDNEENKKWLTFARLCGFMMFYCNAVANATIFIAANTPLKQHLKKLFSSRENENKSMQMTMSTSGTQ